MSRVEVKDSIIENLEKVDEAMLLAVQRMLDTYLAAQAKDKDPYPEDYDLAGNRLDRDEIIQEVELINDRIDAGEEPEIPLEVVQNNLEKILAD